MEIKQILTFASFMLTVADVVSDIVLAADYCESDNRRYCGLTWTFVAMPLLTLLTDHLHGHTGKLQKLLLSQGHNWFFNFTLWHRPHRIRHHRCDSIQGTDNIANDLFLNLRVSRTQIQNLK